MVIPLGLGYIPRKFAIVTLILIVMNFFFYASNHFNNEEAATRIKEVYDRLEVEQLAQHAFLSQCAKKFAHIDCYTYLHPKAKANALNAPAKKKTPDGVEIVEYVDKSAPTPAAPENKEIEAIKTKTVETLNNQVSPGGIKQAGEKLQMAQMYFEAAQMDDKTFASFTAQKDKDNFNRYHTEVAKLHKDYDLLSAYDLTPMSILKSMFSHGNLWHLISNMLVLLIFGTYAELKIGSLVFGCLYMAMGFFSSLLTTRFQNPLVYTVGASGAIFGVLALYYILFFKDYLKLKVFFMFKSRNVFVPNATWFPVIFLLSETVQGFNNTTQFWHSDGVSHAAHAAGALFGFLIGLVWSNLLSDELHPGFHFDFQLQDWLEMIATNSYINLAVLGQVMLTQNPKNYSLKESLLKRYNQFSDKIRNPELLIFIQESFKDQLVHEFNLKNNVKTMYWLGEIQKANFAEELFVTMDANTILALGDYMLSYKKYDEAIIFYQGYIQKYPKAPMTQAVTETMTKVQKLQPFDYKKAAS